MRAMTLLFLLGLVPTAATAQSVAAEDRATKDPEFGAAAANNPYLGFQVGYMLSGDEGFRGLVGAVAWKTAAWRSGPLWVPALANFDFGEILDLIADSDYDIAAALDKLEEVAGSRTGLTAGVFPYIPIASGRATLHGMAGVKANAFSGSPAATGDEEVETVILPQFRLSAGVELNLPLYSARPVVLGAAASRHWFSKETFARIFGEEKSTLTSIEIILVAPLRAGTAVMIEGVLGTEEVLGDQSYDGWRMGIIFVP